MVNPPIDQVMPNGKWAFGDDVTDVFDNMLERSIPQYQIMRQACFDLAVKYQQQDTAIVDLGCSRGEAMAPLVDRFGAYNTFVGVEMSPPMLDAIRDRFKSQITSGIVDIRDMDLRREFPAVRASVVLSVLTLQFTPIEYRLRIVKNIYDHLVPGGALILVEKVLGASADIDETVVRIYYQLKAQNGYSQDQIERKRLSLEGVLVPVTARWNEELLALSGFREIDCFWRWMNFAGWVAIK
ncbi:MAG: methyltransferase domain-containing protein [Anaerolinea sp.]|nr:methyltransferase domain-containing protein [Anaerolinea sp.]